MEKGNTELSNSSGSLSQSSYLAVGGLIGATLATTCCIAPLVLVLLGVGGAWVGNLTALAPYQWYFAMFALGCLAAGFWHVYFRPKAECAEDSYCAKPGSNRLVIIVLWIGSLLVISSILVNVITPFIY